MRKRLNKIIRMLKIKNVKFVYTIRRLHTIFRVKQLTPNLLKSSICYKFECSGDPNTSYIGETGRHLFRRILDHKSSNSSAIKRHVDSCQFCNNNTLESNFKIISTAFSPFDLTITEALLIKKLNPNLNIQQTGGKNCYTLQLF